MTLEQAMERIRALEAELSRVKAQRNKAWHDRAEIHARLRAINSSSSRPLASDL
jgi:uncharacterized small protein (DUF1192 family)